MDNSNNCNRCNDCNSCDKCGGCNPASYNCNFAIEASPYDPSTWFVTICGMLHKIKVPSINETDTHLVSNCDDATLTYTSEKHTDTITGAQLGCLINLKDLRDVAITNPDMCSLLVYNPHCGASCETQTQVWENYHIADATEEATPESDGYYRVLTKDDCGCLVEKKVALSPTYVNTYYRDSVPQDPDFPWYYGNYNEEIQLYLAENNPEYFGKYDLEVTVYYGVQCVRPGGSGSTGTNVNFRSLVAPCTSSEKTVAQIKAAVKNRASILQGNATSLHPEMLNNGDNAHAIPWGTNSLRGSFTFVVPKGLECRLHHEFRLMDYDSISTGYVGGKVSYKTCSRDGQKAAAGDLTGVNQLKENASRIHSLQVIVRPVVGRTSTAPADAITQDTAPSQLDNPADYYPSDYVNQLAEPWDQ